jgi:hypothetical protein
MKNVFLIGLLLVCGFGCKASTMIGVADAGCGLSYPQNGFYGPNILYPGFTSPFMSHGYMDYYEIAASHPVTADLTVKMTLLSGPAWDIDGALADWHATLYDSATGEQTLAPPNVAGESESTIFFLHSGQARLDIFECGATSPTRSTTLTWNETDAGIIYGPDGSAISGADGAVVTFDDGSVISGHD